MRRQEERQFTLALIKEARARGWHVHHVPDSRRATCRGFPDLVMRHPEHGMVVAELKTETGRLTAEQRDWLEQFEQAQVRVFVWRPRHWATIFATLKGEDNGIPNQDHQRVRGGSGESR